MPQPFYNDRTVNVNRNSRFYQTCLVNDDIAIK